VTTAARNEQGFLARIRRRDGSLSHYAVIAHGKVVARIAPEKMLARVDPLFEDDAWEGFK
jgi:hypothetical protein